MSKGALKPERFLVDWAILASNEYGYTDLN